MAEAERRARTEGGEDLLVVLGEGGVGDQQQRHVAFADDIVHFAQRAPLLGEADGRCLLHRGRAFSQADLHPDAGAFERLAQVLRLGRALRRPADDADLPDAVEGLGQQREGGDMGESALVRQVGMFGAEHQRWPDLEHVAARAGRADQNTPFTQQVHDTRGLRCGWRSGLSAVPQFDADEEPGTADFRDRRMVWRSRSWSIARADVG